MNLWNITHYFHTHRQPVDEYTHLELDQHSRISRYIWLSSVCTHAGCVLAASGANLGCDCHGSEFSGVDGAVTQGPARTALTVYRSLEENGTIILLK